jgi:YegS/Rv2252/BmrU family lipid kinase
MPSTDKPLLVFLLNRRSGRGKAADVQTLFERLLKDEPFQPLFIEFVATGAHRAQLEHALAQNPAAVFACGGDGTVNFVGSLLKETGIPMGIIPMGSGNGLARHLGLPMQAAKALKQALRMQAKAIDTGTCAGHFFANVAGLGYDARISHAFKNRKKRGLLGYVQTIAQNLKLQAEPFQVVENHATWQGKAWMICFANGSQWGNNVSLMPGARIDDGTLNALIFQPAGMFTVPSIGFRLLTKKVHTAPQVKVINGTTFHVAGSKRTAIHVDGEPAGFFNGPLTVEICPKSLLVLV